MNKKVLIIFDLLLKLKEQIENARPNQVDGLLALLRLMGISKFYVRNSLMTELNIKHPRWSIIWKK